ncbi:MAG: RlmE family RNA methyltransferase [Treponema sp.]|nr:RlmE family RNA methyltransferase [Treponema sp.]
MADYKKPDHWQLKARQEGYPARSVYKLKEMDDKFGLIKSGHRVLDLGAAPGSWSLYVLRKKNGIRLVSADISPLSRQYDGGLFDGGNFHFIQGDITAPAVRDSIFAHGPYNVILSDAAPATTGNRFVDTSRSLYLAEAVTAYAEHALTANGNLAIKLFQGGDTSELLKHMQTLFKSAKSYKPTACRSDSFEMYYLGLARNDNRQSFAPVDTHDSMP